MPRNQFVIKALIWRAGNGSTKGNLGQPGGRQTTKVVNKARTASACFAALAVAGIAQPAHSSPVYK
jgi:hypothetical protein